MQTHTTSITPFIYSKTKLNFKRSYKNKYDKAKQSRALMPNLIHSLDATTMSLLYKIFSKKYPSPLFFSIHDCFATAAAAVLKTLLASVYTDLYSNDHYLIKFDQDLFDTINKSTDYKVDYKNRTIELDSGNYVIHDIEWVLNKKIVNKKSIKKIDQYNVEKLKYSISGILVSKIKDTFYENTLIRNKELETIYIENNNVIKIKKLIKFNYIKRYKIKNLGWLPNPNIGVIDVETYISNNDVAEVYALGFKTNLANKPVIYYIDKNYDSSSLILQMIDELLRPKYSNVTFYCHNFGGYDVIFILKVLTTYNDTINYVSNINESKNNHKYIIDAILKDDKIIKLTIKKGNNILTILDSYCMLNNSLVKLGKYFGVETQKSVFPYKFSIQDNLFYKGHTPGIDLYNNLSIDEYNDIYSENWSFYDETIKYLNNDLNCLYEILVNVNKQVFNDYKINMKDSITISSLAMKIYLNKDYNENIPIIDKASIYKDIKQGYYGGITEVYKPFGDIKKKYIELLCNIFSTSLSK